MAKASRPVATQAAGRVDRMPQPDGDELAHSGAHLPSTPRSTWTTPSAAQRRPVITALMAAGYPRDLARAASMAAHPCLVDVLLGQNVTWPGCPPAR